MTNEMEKRHLRHSANFELVEIVELSKDYALQLFNKKNDARLVFHNFTQSSQIAQLVDQIGQGSNLPDNDREVAQVAAWLWNLGYLFNYAAPLSASIERAQTFLTQQAYPSEKTAMVLACIQAGHEPKAPSLAAVKLFLDALNAQHYGPEYFERIPLLKLERELLPREYFSKADWTQLQLQQLLKVSYHHGYAKATFEPVLAQHILEQKSQVEKNARDQPTDPGLSPLRAFQHLEKKLPTGGMQTFFRTNYRNHINLSAIADNKANIMISVNAIVISILITVVGFQNFTETKPMLLMPVVLFLITGLSSLIFAVLSARPKVTSVNAELTDPLQRRRNIVFFGNFVSLPLEEYEEAMDAMFRDGELLYGNMTRDLYFLGKVLDKKYRYLTISYNIFMLGFVVTVITFMVAFLTSS